jgi:hypothetical protein
MSLCFLSWSVVEKLPKCERLHIALFRGVCGVKMTALTRPFQRTHCHATTATPRAATACFYLSSTPPFLLLFIIIFYYLLFFILPATTRPILPLPHSNHHHSNRPDPLFPPVPLPRNHCHSPRRPSPSFAATLRLREAFKFAADTAMAPAEGKAHIRSGDYYLAEIDSLGRRRYEIA